MYREIFKDLKYRILDYAHHLSIYDYFAFSWIIIIFLLMVVMTFILIRKKTKIALFIFFFAAIFLMSSPIIIKIYFDKSIKRVDLIDIDIKKLNFAKLLVIRGKIKSRAKIDFEKCRIFTFVVKKTDNKYIKILNYLKFKRYSSILIDKPLKKGKSLPFKIIFQNFIYEGFETKLFGECY